jgi:hypothetical protein
MDACTYSLGFFFGPGRPRSLIGPFGSIDGGARFLPLTAAPPLLRRSTLGGARLLLSIPSMFIGGTGVPFDSLVFSTNSGGCTDGEGSMRDGGDGLGEESDGHAARRSEEMRSVTTRLFFAPLAVDLALVADADMLGDVSR